jgi:hypothetical protein
VSTLQFISCISLLSYFATGFVTLQDGTVLHSDADCHETYPSQLAE